VGTRIDIRDGPVPDNCGDVQDLGPDPVTYQEGLKMAPNLGAYKYLEW